MSAERTRLRAQLRWALPLLLLALFGWRELAAMDADATCADEPWHLAYGERGLDQHTFHRPSDVWNSKMPISMLNALAPRLAGDAPDWTRRLWLARLPTVGLALLLGALVWRWSRRLFGEAAGWLTLALYTCCPNFLAHGHLVTTDVATSLAMCGAIYAFWRASIAPSAARWAVAAAAFGAAQLTKVTAIFLLPIVLVILLLRRLRRRREEAVPTATPAASRARAAGTALAFGAVALAVLNLGFLGEDTLQPLAARSYVSAPFQRLAALPVLRSLPIPLPAAYLEGLDMVARDARAESWSYLRGEYSNHGFRSYFLWALLLKVPLATLLLCGAALAVGWVRRQASALEGPERDAEIFLLTPIAFLLGYLSLFLRLDIGLRYALPVLPFAFVYAGRAAAAVPFARGARLWRTAVAGLVVWLAVASWSIHPHYLTYFNELAGGPGNGWRHLIDSNLDWGQDAGKARPEAAARGEAPPLLNPSAPVAGRIAVGLTALVGADPEAHARNAWLRDNFTPVRTIGNSWNVYQVSEQDLARCCSALPRATVIDDLAADIALAGQPVAGLLGAAGDGDAGATDAEGFNVRLVDRLNDGIVGAGQESDAARTLPPRTAPVRAWFGITWSEPRSVSRIVAYPGYGTGGGRPGGALRNLALDYVLQSWADGAWRDIPGTRVTDNASPRVEHRFAPLSTTAVRLVIERERNGRGTLEPRGFRAACLEIGVYER